MLLLARLAYTSAFYHYLSLFIMQFQLTAKTQICKRWKKCWWITSNNVKNNLILNVLCKSIVFLLFFHKSPYANMFEVGTVTWGNFWDVSYLKCIYLLYFLKLPCNLQLNINIACIWKLSIQLIPHCFLIPDLKDTSDVVLPQETVPNLLDPPYMNIVKFQESLLSDSNYLACS